MLNRFVYGLSTVHVCVACVCINFSAVNPDVWEIYFVWVGLVWGSWAISIVYGEIRVLIKTFGFELASPRQINVKWHFLLLCYLLIGFPYSTKLFGNWINFQPERRVSIRFEITKATYLIYFGVLMNFFPRKTYRSEKSFALKAFPVSGNADGSCCLNLRGKVCNSANFFMQISWKAMLVYLFHQFFLKIMNQNEVVTKEKL